MSGETGPENGPETDFVSIRPISSLLTHSKDMEVQQKGLLISF